MAQLQIKDIPQEFLTALKVAAAQQGKSLKAFVCDTLTVATLPPVVVGGTRGAKTGRGKIPIQPASSPRTIEIKPSGKHSEIQWGNK
jgi:plasmid stability protein